jgi:hypothetical protein
MQRTSRPKTPDRPLATVLLRPTRCIRSVGRTKLELSAASFTQLRIPGNLPALVVAAACLAVFAGYALAETGTIRNSGPAGSEITSKAGPAGGATSKAEVGSAQEAAASGDSGSTTNPRPKWACDQQTVTVEPVWRGQKSLTFAFKIRNEGTADLQIKAIGG